MIQHRRQRRPLKTSTEKNVLLMRRKANKIELAPPADYVTGQTEKMIT